MSHLCTSSRKLQWVKLVKLVAVRNPSPRVLDFYSMVAEVWLWEWLHELGPWLVTGQENMVLPKYKPWLPSNDVDSHKHCVRASESALEASGSCCEKNVLASENMAMEMLVGGWQPIYFGMILRSSQKLRCFLSARTTTKTGTFPGCQLHCALQNVKASFFDHIRVVEITHLPRNIKNHVRVKGWKWSCFHFAWGLAILKVHWVQWVSFPFSRWTSAGDVWGENSLCLSAHFPGRLGFIFCLLSGSERWGQGPRQVESHSSLFSLLKFGLSFFERTNFLF